MADKTNEQKKARYIALQAEITELKRIWAANAGNNTDKRYADIDRASDWLRGGMGGKEATFQEGARRVLPWLESEEDERGRFRSETLIGAPTGIADRNALMDRYRAVKAEFESLDKEVGAQVANAAPGSVRTDEQGRIITKDPVTGKEKGYDPRTGAEIEGFDPSGLLKMEADGGSKPRALTNDDLEDIWRTSNPDITPDLLSKLYPEYNAEGMQINEANPLAFSDPDMIRWDRNPNYTTTPAQFSAYQRELRRILGERRNPAQIRARDLDPRLSPAEMRIGTIRTPPQATHGGRTGSPGQSGAINREASRRAGMDRNDLMTSKETTYSFREAFNLPFTWDSTKVAQMATRLFQAGYMPQLMDTYDPTKPLSQQYPGSLSDPYNMVFRGAYMQWMKDSMSSRDKTSMQILGEREKATGQYFSEMRRLAEEEKAKELARRMAQYTQLTDPDRINSLVDQLGQALIGRKLSPSEKSTYVALIHSQESAYGAARAHAEVEGTGLTQTEVDVQSTLEAQVRADNPVEAMGKDVADQYDEFRKLLGGPLAMM